MSKSIRVIDAYRDLLVDGTATLPPVVAPPSTAKQNVVHIHVPAEHTDVSFGAGKVPGIRMTTDNHVHLTAGTPLTTISLGVTGGEGVAGPNGINILTQGHKTEYVNLMTDETYNLAAKVRYQSTKGEEVTAAWDEKCHNTKTEFVHGMWNLSCDSDKSETITGCKKETYGTHEIEVHGAVKRKFHGAVEEWTTGNLTQHVFGQTSKYQHDDHENFAFGMKSDTYIGIQTTKILGRQLAANVGVQITSNVGATVTNNAIVTVTNNGGVTVTNNLAAAVTSGPFNVNSSIVDINNGVATIFK